MEQINIVDFKATKASEKALTKVLAKHGASVTDWVEKDYGLRLFVDVPGSKASALKAAIGGMHGFTYDD